MLREHGFEPDTIEYLKQTPSAEQLAQISSLLGVGPRGMLRTGEPEYRDLGLADPAISDQALLEAMSRHPCLIQRPIVISGQQARIGRPPETILEILHHHD